MDVGSGSGYLTACLARANRLVSATSSEKIVIGIEHIPDLVQLGTKNITADDPTLLSTGELQLIGKFQTCVHSIR